MTAKEKVAPLEAKPFYGNSECADCNDKLYGKKAFWVPTTGKTPGKKLVCEKCAEVAESLPAEPEHCPNCNHKAHYALRCGALIATGSDGEFAEEVRCECLNWVAEPKPAPSTATGITEDQKRMVNRALDQLDAMLTLPESGDLEEKCQELLQDWEAGTSGFTNDEIEMAEIGFRGGFKAALKLKPQLGDQIVDANKMVDSSSISTEFGFTVDELVGELHQCLHTIEFLYGCLESPNFRHEYPEQTRSRIEFLQKMLPNRGGCIHSHRKADCEWCIEGDRLRSLHQSVVEKIAAWNAAKGQRNGR